jgi:hypothetical protein
VVSVHSVVRECGFWVVGSKARLSNYPSQKEVGVIKKGPVVFRQQTLFRRLKSLNYDSIKNNTFINKFPVLIETVRILIYIFSPF